MKKVCGSALIVAIALAGGVMASNDVVPAQLSPTQYSGYDCAQIAAEQRRLYKRASDLASLGDTGAPEAEYAQLREEFAALREAALVKKCGKAPARLLPQAASDGSAAQGGTGPRIAPPETPLE